MNTVNRQKDLLMEQPLIRKNQVAASMYWSATFAVICFSAAMLGLLISALLPTYLVVVPAFFFASYLTVFIPIAAIAGGVYGWMKQGEYFQATWKRVFSAAYFVGILAIAIYAANSPGH